MIGLQQVSPELRKPPCMVFAPEDGELAVLRAVVADYAAQFPVVPSAARLDVNENLAPHSGQRIQHSVAKMTLRTLQALEIQDPKKGGATPAITFTHAESRFVYEAFSSPFQAEPKYEGVARKLAAQIGAIDLTPPTLTDESLTKAK